MKCFLMKIISILLAFVIFSGFIPLKQSGYAEGVSVNINGIDDFLIYGNYVEDNGTITLKFNRGNYIFNSTVELEAEKNIVIMAAEPDVCFSHGVFSGEMIFVPESSSLTISGYNDDPASPFLFKNTYSFDDLLQPASEEEPQDGEELIDETQETPEAYSNEGEPDNVPDNSSPDAGTENAGEYFENTEDVSEGYEEELSEVFVKSFSSVALVEEPLNLRAITAEGSLSLKNVSFEGFKAAAGLSGAAVSVEGGSQIDSVFSLVTFKSSNDGEGYALNVAAGKTLRLENVTAEECRIKNSGGRLIVSPAEFGSFIDGGFEEQVEEEVIEEPITEETPQEQEQPITEETPQEQEQPITEETPQEQEQPITEEIPQEQEQPITEETPQEQEQPITEETPQEQEQPITEEIPQKSEEQKIEEVPQKPEEEITESVITDEQQASETEPLHPEEEKKEIDIITPSASVSEADNPSVNNNPRVSVNIVWEDRERNVVSHPDKVIVRMKKNAEDYKSAEVSSVNSWKTEFEIDDPLAQYAIEQDPVDGFTTSYLSDNNSIQITNTVIQAKKEQPLMDFLKQFTSKNTDNNQNTIVAESSSESAAHVASDGGSNTVETTVTSGVENVNQNNPNNEGSVQQQTVQSYIDNAPKQSIVVSANWADNNNSARRRPEKAQVSLYLNNSLYMNASISADNNWTYTFSNLTPGNSYRVEQSSVADYSTAYRTSGNTVYISNQYTGAQSVPSTPQQNIQQGYNNPQNVYDNQQTQYPDNAVQSAEAPTVNVTPAPTSTASPAPTPVPSFAPTVTIPTSEPIETESRERTSSAWIWIVLLIVSAGAIAGVLISMDKARKQREAQRAARERARKRAAEIEMRRAQADISEGVRRTQSAENSAQQVRKVQSREPYSKPRHQDYDRSPYRNESQHREKPHELSNDTGYKPNRKK